MPVHREPQGLIRRNGQDVTAPEEGFPVDIAGRCELTLDGTVYDTVCLMDLGEYNEGVASEQYLDREGRTVLWRRFNRDDWALDRYGKKWSELLPDNKQITINGVKYVHWYGLPLCPLREMHYSAVKTALYLFSRRDGIIRADT